MVSDIVGSFQRRYNRHKRWLDIVFGGCILGAMGLGVYAIFPEPLSSVQGVYGPKQWILFGICLTGALGLLGLVLRTAIVAWKILAGFQKGTPAKVFIPLVLILGYCTVGIASGALHVTALFLYEGSPYGANFLSATNAYADRCITDYGDRESGHHDIVDWNSGADVCAPLARKLFRLHPKPSWLFGEPTLTTHPD
jgi:hypothetical protein